MVLKLRVRRVDMDGYCGRDYHPEKSDEGLVVTPLAMASWYDDEDGGPGESTIDGGMAAYPERGEPSGMMWTCLTADGRTLELMDHEVEVVLG